MSNINSDGEANRASKAINDSPATIEAASIENDERTTHGADHVNRRGSLLVIFLTVFIDLLGFGIVLPLLPLYADVFGEDPSGLTIGLLMASFSIMQFLFAPIWGGVSDRIGRRPVLMLGLAGSVIFYSLFGIAAIYQSLTGLFITRIGAGIAGATIPTAQAYIADTTTIENRARGMGLIGMAFGMGFTLGPLFAYFAVPAAGVGNPGSSPGFIAAGLSAIALILAWRMLPESLQPSSQTAMRKWWDRSAWSAAFRDSSIVFLLIGFFICIFSFASFETTLSMLIKGSASFPQAPFQFTYRQVCLTFAAIGFLVAIVQGGIVRRLSKVISEKKLAIAGAVIEVVGFGLISFAVQGGSVVGLFFSLSVIVAGYSCLQPSLYSLLSRWTDPTRQGQVLGVGQSISALARIFGSALGIPMLKIYLFLPYLVGSILMIAVAIAITIACRTGTDFESNSTKK